MAQLPFALDECLFHRRAYLLRVRLQEAKVGPEGEACEKGQARAQADARRDEVEPRLLHRHDHRELLRRRAEAYAHVELPRGRVKVGAVDAVTRLGVIVLQSVAERLGIVR